MGCSSIRILSYISAFVQLVCCVTGLVVVILMGRVAKDNGFREFGITVKEAIIADIVCGIVCVVRISSLLTLIVGIQQKSLKMVSIFIYTHCVFLAFCVIVVVAELIMQVVNEWPIYAFLIGVAICFSFLGTDILFFSPIVILHKKMRATPIQPVTYMAGYTNLSL